MIGEERRKDGHPASPDPPRPPMNTTPSQPAMGASLTPRTPELSVNSDDSSLLPSDMGAKPTPYQQAVLCCAHFDLQVDRFKSVARSVISSARPFSGHQAAVLTETLESLKLCVLESSPKWSDIDREDPSPRQLELESARLQRENLELRGHLGRVTEELAELIKGEQDDPSVGITGWNSLHESVAASRSALASPSPEAKP